MKGDVRLKKGKPVSIMLTVQPSMIMGILVEKINAKIHDNRQFTRTADITIVISELLVAFMQVSISLIHEIVTRKLGIRIR